MRAVARHAPLALTLLLLLVAAVGPRFERRTRGSRAWVVDVSASLAAAEGTGPLFALEQRLRREGAGPVFVFDHELRSAPDGAWSSGGPAGAPLTDPARAIREVTRAVIASGGGSMLLATDGQDPLRNAVAALEDAARSGVTVDVLPLEVSRPAVALEALELPVTVQAGELFRAQALVRSSTEQEVEVTLEREGRRVARASALLRPGALHAVDFLLSAGDVSTTLVAHVAAEQDASSADNVASADLRVAGAPRLAAVGYDLAGSVDRYTRLPSRELLERYEALYLRLGPTTVPSTAEQSGLVRWVAAGHGLVVSCDDPELAMDLRGGPLEGLLPVRLEPPDVDEEASAVVLLVDRSGSMDRTGAAGTALETAFEAAEALAALLGPDDRYGLIAFDVAPHVLRTLGAVGRAPSTDVPVPHPAGGTDWGAALGLALDWLDTETASRRHIVLIGDGRLAPAADGEPGRDWPEGVTLSTVSVGARADRDRLERMALAHGGRHRHVARPDDLPAALRREGARLQPPSRRSGPLSVEATPRFAGLLPPISIAAQHDILIARARPEAERALHSARGDLVLAFRQVGWGRTAFLSGDPAALSSDRPDAAATLVLAALGHVLQADRVPADGPRVTFDGRRAIVEWRLAPGVASWPSGQVRLANGETRDLHPAPAGPRRARAVVVPVAAGPTIVETAGGRWTIRSGATPEQNLPAQAGGWAERWAAAGGGTVWTLDDAALWRPSRATRRTRVATTPWLIALAALIAFVDFCLQPWGAARIASRSGETVAGS